MSRDSSKHDVVEGERQLSKQEALVLELRQQKLDARQAMAQLEVLQLTSATATKRPSLLSMLQP